jgi:hypothetical protein
LTWRELESRFTALDTARADVWIDHQAGVVGEHWHVTGAGDQHAVAMFRELSNVAGTKLLMARSREELGTEVHADTPMYIWFRLLESNAVSGDPGVYSISQHARTP